METPRKAERCGYRGCGPSNLAWTNGRGQCSKVKYFRMGRSKNWWRTLDGVGINCGLEELTIGPTQPMIHFDDNRSSIVVSYSEGGVKDKSRNYKLSASKLREFVLNGDVMIVYIMTCRQIADILTKILGPQQFCQLTDKITGYWVRWKDGKPPERYRYSDMGPNEGPVEEWQRWGKSLHWLYVRDHIQKEQTFLRDITLVSVSGIFFVSLMMIWRLIERCEELRWCRLLML